MLRTRTNVTVSLLLMTTDAQPRLLIVPLTLAQANAVVKTLHRHHKPVVGHRFSLGVIDETGELRGALCAGRPVARAIDQWLTLEVNRVATDGTPNACSALYGAARRVARTMGFSRLITYILASESGVSLRAAGWIRTKEQTGGGSWNGSRARNDAHPLVPKQLWEAWKPDEHCTDSGNRRRSMVLAAQAKESVEAVSAVFHQRL